MARRGRGIGILVLAVIASAVAAIFAWIRHISAPGYRGPVSDHFDGERFHNVEPTPDKSLGDLLRWNLGDKPAKTWQWRDIRPAKPKQREKDLVITPVNHATVLIQIGGINILTDPMWSDRTSPVQWAGPQRYHNPGIRFENLPPIDVVLVSHNHWDHLDLSTLRRLRLEHDPLMLVPLGNSEFLNKHGINGAEDMDWWQSRVVREGIEVVSVPVQHWSTRTRMDLRKTLWSGYVIRTPRGSVYFAGDTGLGSGKVFSEARARLGPFRLALLPIGAYLPRWFMKDNHLSPTDALEAHRTLGASTSVPMHFGCFDLGDDSQDQAAERLREAIDEAGEPRPKIIILRPGEDRAID